MLLVAGVVACAGRTPVAATPLLAAEQSATVAALASATRTDEIAIVAHNDGTETTDFLVPFGILARVGKVAPVALRPGPIALVPALTVDAPETLADFDRRVPRGAGIVIVPAMRIDDDPTILRWIEAQRAKGAVIVGICSGAKVLANAGLLDGRDATGHWDDIEELRRKHPTMRWVPDRRYVVDRGVVTTTGVTASAPFALALVEAIAGAPRAAEIAAELGLASWDARHDSARYGLSAGLYWTAAWNKVAWFGHDTVGVRAADGIDEVALALTADAYSRTYRSQAVARAPRPVTTRHGLRVTTSQAATSFDIDAKASLDTTLDDIERRYGARTRRFVAMQMEY